MVSSTPLAFVAVRFSLATLFFTVLFFPKVRTITTAGALRGAVLGGLLFIGFATQTIGIQYTTASKSAFFTGTLVVFTPLIQFITGRHLPRVGNIVGVLLAAIGLYLLTSPAGSTFNTGDGLTLICAVMFAAYIVYLDYVSEGFDRFHLVYGQVAMVAILSIAASLIFETPHIALEYNVWLSLLYLTIFATMITTWTQTRFQGDTIPTRAAVIFTMEPVLAAIFAYFVRDERLGALGFAGAAVIITGLLVSELSEQIPWFDKPIRSAA
jgi:drug/metabolite transporter (DMT)-like permease